MAETFATIEAVRAAKAACIVMWLDDNNVVLAWHDVGTYNGKPYDKYRLGAWYWSSRNNCWCQGSGSASVPYARRLELLAGLGTVHLHEAATIKLASLTA